MELIDYNSRNLVGLAIPPSQYDEEFVVASIKAFINNREKQTLPKKQANAESTTPIQDARELIQKAEETRKKSNFLKIVSSDNTDTRRNNQTAQKKTETKKITD